MKLFITGATGQIGRRLVADRLARGDHIVSLTRDVNKATQVFDATARCEGNLVFVQGDAAVVVAATDWPRSVNGCDAVIHLAGAGIADRRWSASYKEVLINSRIQSTKNVVDAISRIAPSPPPNRPKILINASAIGYYGDAGDAEITEDAPAGASFLGAMCAEWEAQAQRAAEFGVRVVRARFGVVLDARAGALPKMLLPFRLGLGGPLGSGRQFMPWIHWRDVNGIIDLALRDDRVAVGGALNVVSPNPVRQREFARALGRALHRPAFVPTPKFALRLALGEVADSLLMSQRVVPAAALMAGYVFQFANLDAALEELLEKRE